MFKASYKIATIFGIPIKIHISVVVLLVMYVTDEVLGFYYGLLMAIGMLISICLHELGHSLVAIAKKSRVREITLMFMGGVAQMESIPRRPLDEFLMAIAGPLVSLSLGVSLFFSGLRFPLPPIPGLGEWNYFMLLGAVNGMLAVFNMIPAFPMDGGRVLRASLTPFKGRLGATRIAATIGKAAAWGFGIWALFNLNFFLVAIAFFIHYAATQEYRMVLIQERGRPFTFWDWARAAAGRPPEDEADNDEVIISPPPYERGPASRSRLSEDDSPHF